MVLAELKGFDPIVIYESIGNLFKVFIIKLAFLQIKVIDTSVTLEARH